MVPLVALALAASYYSEYSYQREIKREIISSLNSMTTEISLTNYKIHEILY